MNSIVGENLGKEFAFWEKFQVYNVSNIKIIVTNVANLEALVQAKWKHDILYE